MHNIIMGIYLPLVRIIMAVKMKKIKNNFIYRRQNYYFCSSPFFYKFNSFVLFFLLPYYNNTQIVFIEIYKTFLSRARVSAGHILMYSHIFPEQIH